MSTGLAVTAETSNLRQIELEFVLQPVDSIARAARQNSNKIITGKVSSLDHDVSVKTMGILSHDIPISWCPRRKSVHCQVYLQAVGPVFQHR